jgi:hypothetical protein
VNDLVKIALGEAGAEDIKREEDLAGFPKTRGMYAAGLANHFS